MNSIGRRRFLGLAAFASASVVGVGVVGSAVPAAAESAEPPQLDTTDPDTGWPIFAGPQPPDGYVRNYSPCDPHEYVDVPRHLAGESTGGVTIIEPPYTHADWHRTSGGTP